ncbi:GGDEF domain-containing protein [Patescibacteria group bacterium]
MLIRLLNILFDNRLLNWVLDCFPHVKRLEKRAHHDKLTGLANRHRIDHCHDVLLRMNKRNKSFPKEITMVVFDIDHFKQVNDDYGHDVGDEILCDVANVLKHSKRPNDELVRWGGEEFAMILSDIHDAKTANRAVDRIIRLVNECCLLPNDDSVGISAGVFVDKSGNLSLDELFKKADKNLYEAKTSGRNRVISSAT